MLKNLPILGSAGPRVLIVACTAVTAGLLLYMHYLRLNGELHGLAPIFFVLFAYNDYSGAACALLILFSAVFISPYFRYVSVIRWVGEHPALIAVISGPLLACGTLLVYHDHPLAMDEYAAYFQSRVFAAGHLNGNFPPRLLNWLIPRGFQEYFLNVSSITGNVAETYWPGFALLLTPFTWANVPWACNPVISALTLIVIHRLAFELFNDREAAGLALLLTIASPVIFADGISYYSMPAHLLANSLYVLLLLRPSLIRVFSAGLVGSLALSLHNPVPHMLFAAPWLVWIATRANGGRLICALCAGYLPLCILLGVGWFLFSTNLVDGGRLAIAAGAAGAPQRLQSMLSIFSPPNATVVLARLIGFAKTWIWAVPGLLILASAGAVRWRQNTVCRLLTISALLTIIGYFFVPVDQGHGWGYRYFHSAWLALPLLATAALFNPVEQCGEHQYSKNGISRIFRDPSTKSYVTTCAVLSLIFGVGWRGVQMQTFIAHDLSQVPHYVEAGPQVVIIDGTRSFYGADLVQNDPWLREKVIRMYSQGAAADATIMAEYYPNFHRVYTDRYGTVWSQTSSPNESPAIVHRQRVSDEWQE